MKYLGDSNNIISPNEYSGKYIPPTECSLRGGCFENIVNILLSNIYHNVGKNWNSRILLIAFDDITTVLLLHGLLSAWNTSLNSNFVTCIQRI